MANQSLQKEILDHLNKLPIEQQRQVLDFTRTLAKPVGKQGKELLHFAGGIDPEDLKLMSQAIEQDCEQINSNEW
ncbi:MAG TPA: hypothetical protein VKA70_00690 [Blastocatellia bacterium]|nr:hypothetical protein [Blastocatellia bacterium]